MSEFSTVAGNCFSKASSLLAGIDSEFNNWNDINSVPIRSYARGIRENYKRIEIMSQIVAIDIKTVRDAAEKVESISRKSWRNEFGN